jgi:hypothetical protein
LTKLEFLQRLSNSLSQLSAADRQEVIQDFEEHFSAGADSGKTEEQICDELGTPESCAAPYLGNDGAASRTVAPRQVPYGGTAGNGQFPPYTPQAQNTADVNARQNQFIWRIVLIILIALAFAVYPVALGLMLSPVFIIVAAVFLLSVVPTGWMIAFLVSLAIALFSAGLLTFLIMTALLRLGFRRSRL